MKMNAEMSETPRVAATLPLLILGAWGLVVWVLGLWKLVELIALAVRKWGFLVLLVLSVGCAATKPVPAPPRATAEEVLLNDLIKELALTDLAAANREWDRVARMSHEEQRRWFLMSASPHLPHRDAIEERRPALGMSAMEVEMAMGKPTRVHRTVTALGRHEQWVYEWQSSVWRGPRHLTGLVYLRDGRVVGWQD